MYQQTSGLPMGSALSPILAELFMNNFENNFFSDVEQPNKKTSEEHAAELHDHDYCKKSHLTTILDERAICKLCGATFAYEYFFKKHLSAHWRKGVQICLSCQEVFNTEKELHEHCRENDHKLPYEQYFFYKGRLQCDLCNEGFENIGALTAHKDYVHYLAIIQNCDQNDSKIPSELGETEHRKTFDPELRKPVYTCFVCSKVLKSKKCLDYHLLSHTGEKPYSCDICGDKFRSLDNCRYHKLRMHSGNRPYICDICDKGFIRSNILETHRKSHFKKSIKVKKCTCESIETLDGSTGVKVEDTCSTNCPIHKQSNEDRSRRRFFCDECPKSFSNNYHLQQHKIIHSPDYISPKFPCTICDRIFDTSLGAASHIAIVHEGKRVLCEKCGKSFKSKQNLRLHKKTQHVEGGEGKQFACGLCERKFVSSGGLRTHVRITHEGKRHLCDVCGKALVSAESLKQHLRMHTGEKPFTCQYCEKTFSRYLLLRLHLRVHTKEKPNVCNICGKRYSQRGTLTLHIRAAHSKERPFSCSICSKSFITKTILKTHMKRHLAMSV